MRNRAIKVSLVKDEKNTLEPAPNDAFVTKLHAAAAVTKSLGKDAAVLMCTYIVLDTVRKVAVAKASK
ncbi:MAG TPA: hypothetical protein VLG69_01110 [Candidatus Andersenbacteria bacterium]|nr:hypothetical protein [Candidatus Andersenbacteria bacterium]